MTGYSADPDEDLAAVREEVRASLAEQAKAARARVPGAVLIMEERKRQVDEEGWTPEHDAAHDHGEDLARAAACYALPAHWRTRKGWPYKEDHAVLPREWPWDPHFWKPTPDDRVRELVKAGALIAAEIDRLHAQAKAVAADA